MKNTLKPFRKVKIIDFSNMFEVKLSIFEVKALPDLKKFVSGQLCKCPHVNFSKFPGRNHSQNKRSLSEKILSGNILFRLNYNRQLNEFYSRKSKEIIALLLRPNGK